ncbi:MAG: AsmA family protein [Paracoccaceae bacterium]|nr:AsmA family protein [Paracoccaceae bacterium]
MRWIIRLLALVVLLVAAAGAALFLIPGDRIAGVVASQFQSATGRQMVISGGVHPTLWPELGVRIGHVEIANAPWSKAGAMVRADGLRVGVDPVALLSGAVKVSRVELDAPQILLERNKAGHGNWEMASAAPVTQGAAAPAAGGSGGVPPISIAKAVIRNGAVTWLDDASGRKQTVTGIDSTLTMPDATGPAKIDLAAKVNGQPVSVTLAVAKAAVALAGQATPVDMTLTAGGSSVGYKGTVDPAKGLSGALDAKLGDLKALFAAAAMAPPALPQGLGAKKIEVRGNLTAGLNGAVTLDQAVIGLDDNVLKGRVAVNTAGARPAVNAILSSGKLDLKALAASSGGAVGGAGGSGAPAPQGWSKTPIDVAPLKLADANVTLSAAGIDLGSAVLGQTDVQVTLKDGRAVIGIKQIAAYQGVISGQIVANAANGLAVDSDLTIDKVALQPLLTAFAGYSRLIGTGTAKVRLASSGTSMDALMHGLNGAGSISFGQGELQGFDLAGMLTHMNANYMGAGAKTIFNAITGSFTVARGVLTNKDLSFKSPLLDASGAGTVDIGGRMLDYTVTPVALQGISGSNGVKVPLKISGSWARPQFGMDMNSAVGQQIDKQKKALEDKAKAAAEKALGLPAGGTSGTGSKTLENAAKQGLMKLLGGN